MHLYYIMCLGHLERPVSLVKRLTCRELKLHLSMKGTAILPHLH